VKTPRHAVGALARERRQAARGQQAGPSLFDLRHTGERGLDQIAVHAARPELGPQPPRAEALAASPRLRPRRREGAVVEVPTGRQVRHDGVGDVGRRAATGQAPVQLVAGPRLAGEQVERHRAR